MIISGFAFHCHHDTLLEWVTNYDERVKYIKASKPKNEMKLRLKLFKMIPVDRLPTELVKAWGDYYKAEGDYRKIWGIFYKDKAKKVRNKAWEVYVKTRKACYPELQKLHRELCPNCPWDGQTIFPNYEKYLRGEL